MAMIGGSSIAGTGLAGQIVTEMTAVFGDAYKLVVTMPDGSENTTPAMGTDAMAQAIVNYIKAHAQCLIQIGDETYLGSIL